jgi:hypothetical protein
MSPYDNPSDPRFTGRHNSRDESITRWPPTLGDWLLTGFIVGIFAVIILSAIVKQNFY